MFAVGNVALALHLQVRHFASAARPLPLVCWYDGDRALTHRTWELLAGRPVVLWGWRLQPEILYQAVLADGRLALAGPEELTDRTISHYLRLLTPLDRLRSVQRRAVPWRETRSAAPPARPMNEKAQIRPGRL